MTSAPRSKARPRPVARFRHGGPSLRSRLVNDATRLTVKQIMRGWAINPALGWPTGVVDKAARLLPSPSHTDAQPVRLPHCGAEWLRTTERQDCRKRAVLYLHGGGFVMCGLNTHRAMASELADRSDAAVLNVDYRMLPDSAVPSAVEDTVDGYRWLLDAGYQAGEIAVVGDSAGGYLAFTSVLSLAEAGLPAPAAIATVSPLTDASPTLHRPDGDSCPMLPRSALRAMVRYLRHCHRRIAVDGKRVDLVSPLREDLSALPPVTIHVGGRDLLRTDGEVMADLIGEAGRPCELHVWDGQMHDFPATTTLTPEGDRALGEISWFITRHTGRGPTGPRDHTAVHAA
ncbi:alpha/beta hydrolase [Tomitella gaofuii]|uniref:alpha/beta hydrolase n=1 Tax=Tomitella gaofuii TaxID=2760083 RepID=UPI0015FAC327|nr:alpha/beta hydrolase [Tomitella gaofuii]